MKESDGLVEQLSKERCRSRAVHLWAWRAVLTKDGCFISVPASEFLDSYPRYTNTSEIIFTADVTQVHQPQLIINLFPPLTCRDILENSSTCLYAAVVRVFPKYDHFPQIFHHVLLHYYYSIVPFIPIRDPMY